MVSAAAVSLLVREKVPRFVEAEDDLTMGILERHRDIQALCQSDRFADLDDVDDFGIWVETAEGFEADLRLSQRHVGPTLSIFCKVLSCRSLREFEEVDMTDSVHGLVEAHD